MIEDFDPNLKMLLSSNLNLELTPNKWNTNHNQNYCRIFNIIDQIIDEDEYSYNLAMLDLATQGLVEFDNGLCGEIILKYTDLN